MIVQDSLFRQVTEGDKYITSAMLFGKDGSAGESDAIANYLVLAGTIQNKTHRTEAEEVALQNILERISDEINHLLGDTLDAINIAGLKISSDGIDEIFEGLRKAVDREDVKVEVNFNVHLDGEKFEQSIKDGLDSLEKATDDFNTINL